MGPRAAVALLAGALALCAWSPHSNAQTCEALDARCLTDPALAQLRDAVVKIEYEDDQGDTQSCTGTLLETRGASNRSTMAPYVLTASHCVPDQATANTVQTVWFHQRESCDGTGSDTRAVRHSGGADLLVRSGADTALGDWSLLRLRTSAPSAAHHAPWAEQASFGSEESASATVVTLHHPSGEHLRYASGTARFNTLQTSDGSLGANSSVTVRVQEGIIAGGSSGAGYFHEGHLIGVLTGGGAGCPQKSLGYSMHGIYPHVVRWLDPHNAESMVAPKVSTATISGTSLKLTFDRPLSGTPAASEFQVTVTANECDSETGTLAQTNPVTASEADVTLTLAEAVRPTATVTVAYTGTSLADANESTNVVAPFQDQGVRNNTPVPAVSGCAAPTLADRDKIWEATLSVSRDCRVYPPSLGDWSYGYGFMNNYKGAPSSELGILSDRNFLVDGTSYEVQMLFLYAGDDPGILVYSPGDFVLSLDRGLPEGEIEDLRLDVCSTGFELDDAEHIVYQGEPDEYDYAWKSTSLNWANATELTLTLSRDTSQQARALATVSAVSEPTAPGEDGIYEKDDRIETRVTFNAPVTVDTTNGAPTLGLGLGGVRREAAYESGSGEAELVFALSVAEEDAGTQGAIALANGIRLNGATIQDEHGVDAVLAFGTAPGVSSVEIDPEGEGDGSWGEDETVTVTMVFAEPVRVSTEEGTPSVRLALGGAKTASYVSGSGTNRLVFAYTLVKGDGSHQMVLVEANSLALNQGTIVSTGGLDAILEHEGVAVLADMPRAVVPTLSVADTAAEEGAGATLAFEVRLSETAPDQVTVDYATGDGTATANQDYTPTSGTLAFEAGETAKTIQVTVLEDEVDEERETLTLTLSNPQGAEIEDAEATGTINANAGSNALTASFREGPPEHDGTSPVTVELHFSEEPWNLSYVTVRDTLFTVTGGDVRQARRIAPPSNLRFEMTLVPAGDGPLGLALAALPPCGERGDVCTEDRRSLTGPLSLNVPGPVAISVGDAETEEAPDAKLAFEVSLDRARHAEVRVDWATQDGTAVAGEDYTQASGTLVFAPGETRKSVEVTVLDDDIDEETETMALVLSNAQGARIADTEATGTIRNSDAMPRAWIARFGRTVAEQVVDAVSVRLNAPRTPGSEVTIAGHRVGGTLEEDIKEREESERNRRLAPWEAESDPWGEESAVTGHDLMTGITFNVTASSDRGGIGAMWGGGAVSRFEGEDSGVNVEGEVTSLLLGGDFRREDKALGVIFGQSLGEGTYQGSAGSGEVESSLTGVYPWGSIEIRPRLTLWGVAGYGEGTLTLDPEGSPATKTDMDLVMGATGLRGELRPTASWAPSLVLTADAMAVRATSEEARTPSGGRLAPSGANVTRLRLGVEGSKAFSLGTTEASLTPTVELGARHDGGDAERGFGVELGVGSGWSAPKWGIDGEVRGRTLLSHETDGFSEKGLWGSLTFDPTPESSRGLSLNMTQTMGAADLGGTQALLERETMSGFGTENQGGDSQRLETTLGYGFGILGGRFTAIPELGLVRLDTRTERRLGWRLEEVDKSGFVFELGAGSTWSKNEGGNEGDSQMHLGFGWRREEREAGDASMEIRFDLTRNESTGTDPKYGIGMQLTIRR